MTAVAILLIVCVVAVLHPFVTYPLSLAAYRRFAGPKPTVPSGPAPASYAVVCCMYNEEAVAEAKIANMLALKATLPNCTVMIHSDLSSDGTDAILRAHAGEIHLSFAEKRMGKSAGMNRLLAATDADVVIYTDANVMIDPEGAKTLAEPFRDPQVGCVTGNLVYLNPDDSDTARVGSLYWRFEEWVKQLESDTGSVMGADGSLFAIRRRLHTKVPEDIIDDFFTSMSILLKGGRLVRSDAFRAYERTSTVRGEEFRRKVRISCRAFNCHRLLWPQIRRLDGFSLYKYLSHKLLRWLSGYFLLLGYGLSLILAGMLFGWIGVAAEALATAGAVLAASRMRVPVLSAVWEVVVAMIATALGVYNSLRGKRFQTWRIAASTRQ